MLGAPRRAVVAALDLVISAAESVRSALYPTRSSIASAGGRRAYDSAATGARVDGWFTVGSSANAEVQAGLAKTRDRSRDVVRNAPYGRAASERFVSHLVGVGIRPILDTGDKDEDRRVQLLWDRWGRRCCPSSRLGIYGVETLLARTWFEGGEVLARRRFTRRAEMPGLPPLQLQVLEGDHLDEQYTERANDRLIVQGVEFDQADRRVAYHLWRNHPGDAYGWTGTPGWAGTSLGERVRVPAADVLHLMQELRPGQVRGMPWMHAVIQLIWDLAGYTDAERVRKKTEACLTATVEGGDEEEDVNPSGIAPTTAGTPPTPMTDKDGRPIEQLRPGWIMYAPPGKKVAFNTPSATSGYREFTSVGLHEFAAGIGMSYEVVTGDLSGVNFSSIRLGLNDQHRIFRALREQVFCALAMDQIWEWFIEEGIVAGLLEDDPIYLLKMRWSRPRIESVDRLTDAKADQLEMRNGTRGRRSIIADGGQDPDEVDAEIKADNDNRDKLGIILDSDPRQTSGSGQASGQGDAFDSEDSGAQPKG